ncbi:UBR5 [Acrasis kona]|uniref:UBR5 n=1 Tax=Acrasis kona TaxID=1008807 RepID=A0AAW2YSV5_9EUKA
MNPTVRRGIPLGSVIKNLCQTRNFSNNVAKAGSVTVEHAKTVHHDKSHHGNAGHHDEHHDEHHDDHHHDEPPFQFDFSDPYYGVEKIIPKPSAHDVFICKMIGAIFVFWVCVMTQKNGLRILGLEQPHWEHGFGDSDSEKDDEDWDEEEDALSDNDIDELVTLYMADPRYKTDKVDKKIRTQGYLPELH